MSTGWNMFTIAAIKEFITATCLTVKENNNEIPNTTQGIAEDTCLKGHFTTCGQVQLENGAHRLDREEHGRDRAGNSLQM